MALLGRYHNISPSTPSFDYLRRSLFSLSPHQPFRKSPVSVKSPSMSARNPVRGQHWYARASSRLARTFPLNGSAREPSFARAAWPSFSAAPLLRYHFHSGRRSTTVAVVVVPSAQITTSSPQPNLDFCGTMIQLSSDLWSSSSSQASSVQLNTYCS